MKIITSDEDTFLYDRLITLFQEIKLVRGGTDFAYTLRNHPKLRNYCRDKQIDFLTSLEERYFNSDGSLNSLAIQSHHVKNRSLH